MTPGQVLVIAGRPGHGKSTMMKDCCRYASFNLGLPSLFVSYEMRAKEITARLMSDQARVLLTHLTRPGLLDATDLARIEEYRAALVAAPMFIVDSPDTSLAELDRLIRVYRPRLVAVDYAQIAVPPGPDEHRRIRVERFSGAVKQLAKRREVPILLGSQLNRANTARRDNRPHLSDLRETGALEQDADVVIIVNQPQLYDPNDRIGEADAIVPKQRNGPTDTVPLAATLHYARFADMA